MDSGLANRRILVTGASGGIGQATVQALRSEGACICAHYYRNELAARSIADQGDGRVVAARADLRREDDVDRLFRQAVDLLGGLDGIVVNAGIWTAEPAPVAEMAMEQWRSTLDADLTSAFLTCRAFLRHLATRGGRHAESNADTPTSDPLNVNAPAHADEEPRPSVRGASAPNLSRSIANPPDHDSPSIVLVASTAALFGEADHADYACAKSAMAYGLTLSLKNEIVRYAPRGRVNCICPGWTDTPMATANVDLPAILPAVTATMPLRKIAKPQDVANAILFLLSDRLASHISGAIVPVAGGMEGRLLNPPIPNQPPHTIEALAPQ